MAREELAACRLHFGGRPFEIIGGWDLETGVLRDRPRVGLVGEERRSSPEHVDSGAHLGPKPGEVEAVTDYDPMTHEKPVYPRPTPAPCLTYGEAGEALGRVSRRTVARLVDRGELTRVRVGRRVMIEARSLEALVARGGTP
jgi:excisionase family DNA binding protein